MDDFTWHDITTDELLHYKLMLINTFSLISVGVVRTIYFYISFVLMPTPAPVWIFCRIFFEI